MAEVGTIFEQYRPYFLVVAMVLLGVRFYVNYFRKERQRAFKGKWLPGWNAMRDHPLSPS